jgi:hypothetical protein
VGQVKRATDVEYPYRNSVGRRKNERKKKKKKIRKKKIIMIVQYKD